MIWPQIGIDDPDRRGMLNYEAQRAWEGEAIQVSIRSGGDLVLLLHEKPLYLFVNSDNGIGIVETTDFEPTAKRNPKRFRGPP
jgi:hypothetical protein